MNIGNRYAQHSFAQAPEVKTGRSSFDRSFALKDTFDFDYLVPIFCDSSTLLNSSFLKRPLSTNIQVRLFPIAL